MKCIKVEFDFTLLYFYASMQVMQRPLFSIVIPTLGKVDQWLWAIQSVREQTFSDFEIIAIDSGPEEKSRPAVQALKDNRIIYVNTASGNPRLNWDTGYRKSSGRYLLWLDDDNYLLPEALKTLAEVAEKEDAEIISGEHYHYRGTHHAVRAMRNQLIIPSPPLTNEIVRVDSKKVLRRLLGWEEDIAIKARFHTSTTAVRRDVVERLLERLGRLDFGSTSTNALRLGMLAISQNVFVADRAIALIGQSGKAMTDTWPKIDSPVLKEIKYSFSLSPLSSLTYNNYRHEQHLQTIKLLKEYFTGIEINLENFYASHMRELIFFKQSWKDFFKNWRELRHALEESADPHVQALSKKLTSSKILGLAVKVTKTLGLYPLIQLVFTPYRKSGKPQQIVPLEPYGIANIRECAQKLPEITASKQ